MQVVLGQDFIGGIYETRAHGATLRQGVRCSTRTSTGPAADGLPPEKWSSLMYGFRADGGPKNAEKETQRGRDRHEASAG
jgi:beta-glucanase (GH16 family)